MNVLEKYKGNIKCYIKLCDSFLDSNKNKDILTFESFSNFGYFSNLLKNIIDNISSNLLSNDINSYKLFDKIICIGEKSVYEDTYICGLLSSENQIFKKELIWKNSIKNKLINLYEDICNKEFYSENTKVASHYFRKSLTTFEKLFYTKGNIGIIL
jgi:multimeric flavodoxin WrbA